MKRVHILLITFIMFVMTGCNTKQIDTAVEVAEQYRQSDYYKNCHMDGSMLISVASVSEEELSLEMPVEVSISEDIYKDGSDNRNVFIYEGENCRKGDSSGFDYNKFMNITDAMFQDADLTIINAGDEVVYSVVLPMSEIMQSEDLVTIFADTKIIDTVSFDIFEKLISDASVVYTFDKNFNLKDISCDSVSVNSVMVGYGAEEDISFKESVTMDFSYTFSELAEMSVQ